MSVRTKLGVDMDVDTHGVGAGLDNAGSRFSKFGAIAKKALVGVSIAAVGLVGVGAKLAQGAAEDQVAQTKLATVIKNSTDARNRDVDSVERWITAQGKALGVADDDLRPALSRLVAVTHDVGEAQKLTSLAMDVSAGTGKSLETVTTALAKAQLGSLGGLSRLGVATKDQEGNTLTLEQATSKLARTYDGAASKAADTAAGKYQILKVQISELGESIGYKLLPIATKLGNWLLDDALPAAEKVGKAFGHVAHQAGDTLGPALRSVGHFIEDRVIPAGQKLYSWYVDKIAPGISRAVTPVIDELRSVVAKVTKAVEDNSDKFEHAGGKLKDFAEFIADKVAPVVGKLASKQLAELGTGLVITIKFVGWLIDQFDAAADRARVLKGAIDDLTGSLHRSNGGGLLGGTLDNLGPLGGVLGQVVSRSSSTTTSTELQAAPASRGPVVVDASVTVQVDGSGIVDENAIARTLAPILERHAQRVGSLAVQVV